MYSGMRSRISIEMYSVDGGINIVAASPFVYCCSLSLDPWYLLFAPVLRGAPILFRNFLVSDMHGRLDLFFEPPNDRMIFAEDSRRRD